MTWLAFLLVGAMISGNEATAIPLETSALQHDVLAKGMMLENFSLFLQRMYNKETNDKGEEVVESITKIAAKDDTEVIAAIYDRYVSFSLTINYLACVQFYKAGAAAPEAGEAEGCDEYAKYVSWFNRQFTAKEFFEQLRNPGLSGAEYNLAQVVSYMEILFERQEVMIKAFEKSGANTDNPYADVFQILRQPTEDAIPHRKLTEDDAKPLVKAAVSRGEVEDKFRMETLERLYKFYDDELVYVHNYWSLFFSLAAERPLVTHPSQMVRDPLVEEDTQRSHFKVMEETNLDPTIHDFQNAHEVQYAGLLYHGLEMRVRNIGEVLSPKRWRIITAKEGSQVDFLFLFTEDPPTTGGVGTSSRTTRVGGGPGSSSGGGEVGYERFAAVGLAASAGSSDAPSSMDV